MRFEIYQSEIESKNKKIIKKIKKKNCEKYINN